MRGLLFALVLHGVVVIPFASRAVSRTQPIPTDGGIWVEPLLSSASAPAKKKLASRGHVAARTPSLPFSGSTPPGAESLEIVGTPPHYPFEAREVGLQGRALVELELDAEGCAAAATLQESSGTAILDQAALAAAAHWCVRNGVPLAKIQIPVEFSLQQPER